MEQRAGNAAVRPGTPAAVKAVQGVQHIRVQRFPAQVRPAGAALRQAGEIIAQQRRAADGHLEEVNAFQLELMKEIEVNKMPLHRSELYLSILQLYREIINRYTVIVLLQRELNFMLTERHEEENAPAVPAKPQAQQ